MADVNFIDNQDLLNIVSTAGLNSVLNGGRSMRDWTTYHYKNFEGSAEDQKNSLPPTIEFFVNPKGNKKSVIAYDFTDGEEVHNVVTSGKADEPMLITGLALRLDVGAYSWEEDDGNSGTETKTSSAEDQLATFNNILKSGRFTFTVNNQVVSEYQPLGTLGTKVETDATQIKNFGYKIQPITIAPYIYIEDGITISAQILFEKELEINCPVRIGIDLIGFKFFKRYSEIFLKIHSMLPDIFNIHGTFSITQNSKCYTTFMKRPNFFLFFRCECNLFSVYNSHFIIVHIGYPEF